MGFLGDFLGSVLGGGGSVSGSAAGGADAYKGDGPMGIGEFLKGVASAYRIEQENTGQTVLRLRDDEKLKLTSALDHALNDYIQSEFKKTNAIVDARAARDDAFHTYADEYLPQLYGKLCASGAYNSTAAQLLANDAYARTVVKAQQNELQNIKDYAQLHNQEGNLVVAIFGRLIESYTQSNTSRHYETKPDIGQFGEDAAAYMLFMGVIQLFSKRPYFADSSGSNGGGSGLWDWLPDVGDII